MGRHTARDDTAPIIPNSGRWPWRPIKGRGTGSGDAVVQIHLQHFSSAAFSYFGSVRQARRGPRDSLIPPARATLMVLCQRKKDPAAAESARAWSPSSWKNYQPSSSRRIPDCEALEQVLAELAKLAPLVTSWEVSLCANTSPKRPWTAVRAAGRRCAERTTECSSQRITNRLEIILQMSLALVQGAQSPVIRIGRFAGQYAKPRSSEIKNATASAAELPRRPDQPSRVHSASADRRSAVAHRRLRSARPSR